MQRIPFEGAESDAWEYHDELKRDRFSVAKKINPLIKDLVVEFLKWYKRNRAESTTMI